MDAVRKPLKVVEAALRGPRTEGEMAPEIPLDQQRPADYTFRRQLEHGLAQARAEAGSRRMRRTDRGLGRG